MSYTPFAMEFQLRTDQKQHIGFVLMASACAVLLMMNAIQLDMSSHLLYGAFGGFLGFLILLGPWKSRHFLLTDGMLLAFLLMFHLSFGYSQHPYGFQEFTTFFVGSLLYFLARFWDMPRWPFKEILVWGGTLVSVYGFFEFLTGPGDRLASIFHGMESYSFYPNAMALFLLAVIPTNVVLFLTKPNKRFLSGALLLNLAAFWLTFSRGSALSLIVVAAFGLIFASWQFGLRRVLKPAVLILGIALISILVALLVNDQKPNKLDALQRASSEDISSAQSVSERFEFWKGAVEMSMDYPAWGVGPGGFEYFYPNYQDYWLVLSSHPHNLFLKLASESGIASAALFLVFLLSVAGFGARRFFRRQWNADAWTFTLILLGFLAHNFIDYNLNFTLLSAIFFLSLGGLLRTLQSDSPVKNVTLYVHLALRAWLFIFALFIFATSVWQGMGMYQLYDVEELWTKDEKPEEALALLEGIDDLPFDWNRLNLQGDLYLEMEQKEALKSFLSEYEKNYPQYYPVYYYLSRLDPAFLPILQEKNAYNSLEHIFLQRPELAEADVILDEYRALLAVNMHHTILSENPYYAEKIYLLHPDELALDYRKFLKLWENETLKFDRRFHTTLHYEFTHRHEKSGEI